MDIDMQKFCATEVDSRRYVIEKPFVISGWKYATDGRVAIRVPTTEAESNWTAIPKADRLFRDTWNFGDSERALWPQHDGSRSDEDCVFCSGTGKEIEDCPCAGGARDEDGNCKVCHNTWEVVTDRTCAYCDGHGKAFVDPIICGAKIFARYARLIGSLPGVQLFNNCSRAPKDKHAVPFVFDGGGQGLIMPVVK